MNIIQNIQNRIHNVRGERVMLDFDLASLYEVETKVLNQGVKRNAKRFPENFMFRLTNEEWRTMRSQFVTASPDTLAGGVQIINSSQNKRDTGVTPYVFTEQGVAMLSGILNSDKAISMNIAIMRAFVEIRRIVLQPSDIKEQLLKIRQRISEHDVQLSQIYGAIENLPDDTASQRKWNERARIGFKNNSLSCSQIVPPFNPPEFFL